MVHTRLGTRGEGRRFLYLLFGIYIGYSHWQNLSYKLDTHMSGFGMGLGTITGEGREKPAQIEEEGITYKRMMLVDETRAPGLGNSRAWVPALKKARIEADYLCMWLYWVCVLPLRSLGLGK